MSTAVIVIVLAVIVFFAARSGLKHFKGEGGCCGGGGELKRPPKKLNGTIIAKKTVHIEGMHCDHCKSTVERYINDIDGAAAKVNLKKNIAVVSMTRDVSDEEISKAVEEAGFKTVSIEKGN